MKAINTLEFDTIREDIAEYASTRSGQERIRSMAPLTDRETLEGEKGAVRHVVQRLEDGQSVPIGEVDEIAPVFQMLRREGAVAEIDELRAIQGFLLYADEIVTFCHGEENPVLSAYIDSETLPRELLHRLRASITPEGEISEVAVPELRRLKGEIGRVNRLLMRRSEEMVRSTPQLYNGEQATVRDGRVVLPLAANFKGRIDGIVHESSGSGETLFVEPRELVDLNNELIQVHHAIHQEIRRVLRELSASIRDHLEQLTSLYDAVVLVDTFIARGRWGYDRGGVVVTEGPSIDLINARHPLLGQKCVPLTITFDRSIRMLVVSGPNTGGKTVLIKTVGLLTMLNQIAVPIPASPESSLPLFSFWGVDIGDEQSIEESLSTFSSHMRNIAEVLNRADRESLILLDELGSGTDPEEGGALSMAIVDSLIDRKCTILVSTHQTVLKHYGYTREGAQNVSMAFDTDTHRPTYKVIAGRPGSSHAIDTAREQGVPESVIAVATGYAENDEHRVAAIINRLLEEEERLAVIQNQLEAERANVTESLRSIAAEREALDRREADLRKGKIRELDRTIREARKMIEGEVRRIRESGDTIDRERIKAAHERIGEIEEVRNGETNALEQLEDAFKEKRDRETSLSERSIEEGMNVRHIRTQREGVVRNTRGDSAEVQFGAIRMNVPKGELEPLKKAEHRKSGNTWRAHGSGASQAGSTAGSTAVFELDVRGMRLAQAIDAVERQVDNSILLGLHSFSILHGTGTGVLQKGVQDYLKGRSEVSAFRFALPKDGGFGKTMVELSDNDR